MGQKVNPLSFRLGITKNHHSHWFAQPKIYSEYLQEDERVRNCIENYVHRHIRNSSNYRVGIARVEIQRKTDLLLVEIHTEFPALLIESNHGQGIEQLKRDVQRNLLNRIQRVHITLTEIAGTYGEPNILAKYIALQLRSRVAFRRITRKAIELEKKKNIKGIKIQIAGRLNGAEIARVEWAREGRVPLQTLRAQIDYCYYPAKTIHGILGIKVWIFRDEQ
uniref:ribosomal protein S3 n=1 Tax=Isoetes occidentalis TaxID=1981229 RepID=UPI001EACE11A|nr:ribosomal protein S3 [Isoetes occidentalis]UDP54574.1 ribosomal protein S3 [Isoetes aff. sp. A PWS-2021]UDP54910.1 ribosomal protein S3 [Isoetes sp. A PWS-2021]UDP55078.1 ribosomal protein S3 [Isoetes occidentalis]UDP55162.1 ribosomal protein S3 [Isoetes occidentalis]WAB47133.1 ribosomal protein S3 [Isoetes occidentalis]